MSRLTRGWKAILLVAVGAVAGGAAFAVASVPDSNGLVHLCYVVTNLQPAANLCLPPPRQT